FFFFFSSRRRHTRSLRDWSSDVCSSDLKSSGFGRIESMYLFMRTPGGTNYCAHLDSKKQGLAQDQQDNQRRDTASDCNRQRIFRSEERRVGKECRAGGGQKSKKRKVDTD